MNNLSKFKNLNLTQIIKSYPKKRPKLTSSLKKIFRNEYKLNRENKLISFFERWMHLNISVIKRKTRINTLEIGAGTLNHLIYEKVDNKNKYDVIEPKKFLYNKSIHKKKINKFYSQLKHLPDKNYDRIISSATLEHLSNLPEFLALSSYKLKNNKSFHSHSIPCEGYPSWTIANRFFSGFIFWLRTGCNYNELMKYEHLNNYDEIYSLIRFFYKKVKLKFSYPFFFTPYFSFYVNITFSNPDKVKCKKYLSLYQNGTID